MNLPTLKKPWHPIAASTDLVSRHVFHAQLFGRELAVWRADDGHVNAWENRCLHRGVRLSIGINDGRELVCQYHGWRYANRTAGCTYIPAHPADAPARTICNNQYPVIEKGGLIWACVTDEKSAFVDVEFPAGEQLVLRAMPINASSEVIFEQLINFTRNDNNSTLRIVEHTPEDLTLRLEEHNSQHQITVFLQPVDSNRTILRAILCGLKNKPNSTKALPLLRNYNAVLSEIRELAEQQMLLLSEQGLTPLPWDVVIKPVSEALASMPGISKTASALLRVKVANIQHAATAIKSIELESIEGQLPTFHAGAHIDVHLPNGLTRQYSLTNAPGQTDRYIIGVKREADSSGGSAFIHDTLKIDDVIAISAPRNNFPMRRDAVNTLLIAGGIGITPLLSMARAMHHSPQPFQLHYFVQGEEHQAFSEILESFGSSLIVHTALDPAQVQVRLAEILQPYAEANHVYVCGPGPMLDTTRSIAEENNWPDEAVHFEYFQNAQVQDNSAPFEAVLARSGLTLQVPAGKSLLDVLRENNVDLPSSCEQGACGTCRVTVTQGEPMHQDVYLSHAEQQRGDCMMTCVSRAKTDSLTLDI